MIKQHISFLQTFRASLRGLTITWASKQPQSLLTAIQQYSTTVGDHTVLSPVQNLGQDFLPINIWEENLTC